MATKEYSFHYGKKDIRFSLDPSQVIGELKIKEFSPIQDPVEAIRRAIRAPVQSRPFREIVKPGQTVVFIVNDTTRVANSHVFMPILLDELNETGVPDRDISIAFALGTHHPLNQAEMESLVSREVAARVKMHNPDCHDLSQYKYMGTTSRGNRIYFYGPVTEADHVVLTGSIVYHYMAGFGGGRKALFQGVAAYETIRVNHSFLLDPNARIGKLQGNPVVEDQMEGVRMLPPSFLLNVVLNEKKEFLKVFAGDYIQAHLEGCKFVESIYGTPLKQPADLVIASCGGFPKDINVYQLQKTMDNAWLAVREGGVVIILGECIEGTGSEEYERWMREYKTPERIEEKIRANFVIGGHKAYTCTRLMRKARFILISCLDPDLSRNLLFTPARDIAEALRIALEKLGPKPRVLLMPQGSLTVPIIRN